MKKHKKYIKQCEDPAPLARIVRIMMRLYEQIDKELATMERSAKNRIAAHKAHMTMAKRRTRETRTMRKIIRHKTAAGLRAVLNHPRMHGELPAVDIESAAMARAKGIAL